MKIKNYCYFFCFIAVLSLLFLGSLDTIKADEQDKLKSTNISFIKKYINISDLTTEISPSVQWNEELTDEEYLDLYNSYFEERNNTTGWVSSYNEPINSIGNFQFLFTVGAIANDWNFINLYADKRYVEIKYVDENQKEIKSPDTLWGITQSDATNAKLFLEYYNNLSIPSTTYTSEIKEIPGYTFKQVIGNQAGSFTPEKQTIIYMYQKIDEKPAIGGEIIVKYIDDKGNMLSNDINYLGNIGESYATDQKIIPGYTFKEVQGPSKGLFIAEEQTVTYIYTKNFNLHKYNTNKITKDTVSHLTNGKLDNPNNDQKKYPQTGERENSFIIFVGVLLLIISLFLFFKTKIKNNLI